MTDTSTIRIGSRGSALARWQSDHIAGLLHAVHPDLDIEIQIFSTRGDEILDTPLPLIGGKGLFTAELEEALRGEKIDLAVHSLKDLPTENPQGLTVGAVPHRADPHDALVSRQGYTVSTLPQEATVGTSSRRRAAQLLNQRPDLEIIDLRGNVPTRVGKAHDPDGPYDAVVLARAGLERLGRLDDISQQLPFDVMLPAPGQGALGVQCRADDRSLELLTPLNDPETRAAVTAERAFLAGLQGGCSVPIAAFAVIEGGQLRVSGRVSAVDGSHQIDVSAAGSPGDARDIGLALAQDALAQGAADLLEFIG